MESKLKQFDDFTSLIVTSPYFTTVSTPLTAFARVFPIKPAYASRRWRSRKSRMRCFTADKATQRSFLRSDSRTRLHAYIRSDACRPFTGDLRGLISYASVLHRRNI